MKEVLRIIEELKKNDLFNKDTLIMTYINEVKTVYNSEGKIISTNIFDEVFTKYACITSGTYSLEYSNYNRPLKASNDDAAMMFGPIVKVKLKDASKPSIIRYNGFLATGRFINELIAQSILLEKMCKAEMLASKIGTIKYLNPILCVLEHIVYKLSYSKKARLSDE